MRLGRDTTNAVTEHTERIEENRKMRNHSVMMSLLETAKLRKLNAKEILLALLKRDENRYAELFDAKPPCNTS